MTARTTVIGLVAVALTVTVACSKGTEPPPPATVYFELDAPLCSSQIPVMLFIDGALVGKDTFRVHLAPDHTKTRGFRTPAGTHELRAQMDPSGSPWPAATVDLEAGEAFTQTLPLYCS